MTERSHRPAPASGGPARPRLWLSVGAPVLAGLALFTAVALPLTDRLTLRWAVKDSDLRASVIATTLDGPLRSLVAAGDQAGVRQLFARIARDERLFAIGYCATPAAPAIASPEYPARLGCAVVAAMGDSSHRLIQRERTPLLASVRTVDGDGLGAAGRLVLVHDLGYALRRSRDTRGYLVALLVALAALATGVALHAARVTRRGWLSGVQSLLRRRDPELAADDAELQPIANDLRTLIGEIEAEHRLRDHEQLTWTAASLRHILDRELRGTQVIVVSNREPFIHVRAGDQVALQRPASGLVTAVEPIMRACSGTWIAHGSGSADRDVVDRSDRIAAPVPAPGYHLRRVWLTAEEEAGYYYGFANEGLWPLCHIAHVRPVFRRSDWAEYERVNQRFADAVVAEATAPDPVVLVQDYHLALVPRMIRQRLPRATIVTFWHIPWPNPEVFAICPWREELLDGLLGSSIVGFHTQFHCNNFVDTVDRLIEARVDRETFAVTARGQRTLVKPYPISVEWRDPAASPASDDIGVSARAAVRRRLGLPDDHALGIGVDRLDYTKGIEERFRAVEQLMELRPEWIGRFTLVQVAAPTRGRIEQYAHYEHRVRELADAINARFARGDVPPPIRLLVRHHEPHEVREFYRAADVCVVSSLHDGMNLVAKEFVAARDDDDGVLVLSQFTGAARELPEALIVNPYDAEQCALALDAALTMPAPARRARMRLMRGLVREFNVYRWAGRMLLDASWVRRRGRFAGRAPGMARFTRAGDVPRSHHVGGPDRLRHG